MKPQNSTPRISVKQASAAFRCFPHFDIDILEIFWFIIISNYSYGHFTQWISTEVIITAGFNTSLCRIFFDALSPAKYQCRHFVVRAYPPLHFDTNTTTCRHSFSSLKIPRIFSISDSALALIDNIYIITKISKISIDYWYFLILRYLILCALYVTDVYFHVILSSLGLLLDTSFLPCIHTGWFESYATIYWLSSGAPLPARAANVTVTYSTGYACRRSHI